MEFIFSHPNDWFVFLLVLFFGMLFFLELGRHYGHSRFQLDPKGARAGVGGVEGAVFALFGLLIAFTFSGAATRFDQRRHLIVEEANDVGTAYLRIDLLPTAVQAELRGLFRAYLTKRVEAYAKLPDTDAAEVVLAESQKLQGQIWRQATVGCSSQASPACAMLLLPSLNAMFDIATSRKMAMYEHPPSVIYLMLSSLGMVCSLMAGFAMAEGKSRNWLYSLSFAFMISVTCYVILDLEYPRLGFLQVKDFDLALHKVLESMQ